MALQLNEKEARTLGFALQAHDTTTCKDPARPILGSVLLTETEYGFTLTSTDSHVLFHTSHQLEEAPALESADISGPASLLMAVEEKHGFRDIGKALAKATGPVTFGPTYRGTEQKFNFDGGGVYVPPVAECPGEFPKWVSLFPTEPVELGANRGLNLNPRLVTVMGKLGGFADKAAKIWSTGQYDGAMYIEPAVTDKKPAAFVLNVEPRPMVNSAIGSWHGLVMPMSRTGYGLNDPAEALLPEAVRNV
tara:strand:+ start:326 stop:1072 length:747 start_codon:yes stop_codon:yes gene_type:complete